MRLPKFEYVEAASVAEAASALAGSPTVRALAGGTDLLVNLKHRVEQPTTLVNLKRIPGLDAIRQDNGALKIGALTPLKKLYQYAAIVENLPGLALAAGAVGSYHHQAMGTIGGNVLQQTRCKYFNQSKWWRSARPLCYKAGGEVCHVVNQNEVCYSTYCGDMAPALLVLDAEVVLQNANDTRQVPLESLYSGAGHAPFSLAPGEILTEIVIPKESLSGFSVYKKFANRESIDFPIVGGAFWTSADRKKSRIAFTGVDRRPVRAKDAEAHLNQNGFSAESIEAAAELAGKSGRPTKSSLYSPSLKRKMMGILFKTAVKEAGKE